jgi:hypothetical protein
MFSLSILNYWLIAIQSALPSIEVLYRIRKQRPDLFDKMESAYKVHHNGCAEAEPILNLQYTLTVA